MDTPQDPMRHDQIAENHPLPGERNDTVFNSNNNANGDVSTPLIITTGMRIPSPPRKSDKLMANLRMPLLQFSDDGADTLVYIDSYVTEKTVHHWFSLSQSNRTVIPHRMHSRKLLGTGSPVLKEYFNPHRQARARKCYGLTQNMPPAIKYVIDLTPASEGDDAVVFMTELSCPQGVREWAKYQSRWKLPNVCVGGQDEVEWLEVMETEPPKVEPVVTSSPKKAKKKSRTKEGNKIGKRPPSPARVLNWEGNLPTLRPEPAPALETKTEMKVEDKKPVVPVVKKVPGLPLDYLPLRHRTCLERILHALEELDPELDTTPKMWTFFALSKLLGIAENPLIGDHIVAWLYEGNNPLFVEINPEIAYRMACGLKNTQLCQDSYAILVGEEALSLLYLTIYGVIPKRADRTLHGRNREPLDDTEIQRIEYASKVFLERVLDIFIQIAGNKMEWLEAIVWKHLRGPIEPRHELLINNYIKFCKDVVRTRIYQVLQQQRTPDVDFEFQIVGESDYPGVKYQTAIADMPLLCRILTRTFWKSLSKMASSLGEMSTAGAYQRHFSLKDLAPGLPNLKDQDNAKFESISMLQAYSTLDEFHKAVNNCDPRDWAGMTFREYFEMQVKEQRPVIYFDRYGCETDVGHYLRIVADGVAAPGQLGRVGDGVRFEIVDTLVSLTEDEFKFLPLWAGGNDDGTGGVFIDHDIPIIPNGGFSTAGPSIHTGSREPSEAEDSMGSSLDSIDPDDAVSTVQRASHEATDSHATTIRSTFSMGSSEFELVDEVRNMDIRSETSAMSAGDDDVHFDMDSSESDNDYAFNDDDDDDDDDDDNDTIAASDGE